MSKADATELSELAAEASPGFDLSALDGPGAVLRVASTTLDGPAVAYAVERWLPPEVELLALATSPEARRRGAARALLLDLMARARRAGCTRITLEVGSGNAAARSLYAGLGFRAFRVRPRYYRASGQDALELELCLDDPPAGSGRGAQSCGSPS